MYSDNRDSIFNALIEDTKVNFERMKKDGSQTNRRNYLRSLFTMYEASLSNLRERVSDLIIIDWEINKQIKIHDIVPLLDEQISISKNGKLEKNVNKISFVSLVAYSLKKYSELVKLEGDILGDNKWNDFKKTIEIRNRIMHPKFERDVRISEEELKIINSGRNWWNESLNKLFDRHSKLRN